MAISIVGTASNQAANGGDVTVTLPGGVQENDVVYAAYTVGHTSNVDLTVNSPAGYSELADLYANNTADTNLGVYRKVQTSTPDTSITFEGHGDGNSGVAAALIVLRGVDTTTPEDATTTTAVGNTQADPDPPAITTATDGALVIAFGGNISSNSDPVGPPSGYTLQVSTFQSESASAKISIATLVKATAGAEDPGTFDASTSLGGSWCAATVAVRPAAAAGRSYGFIIG